MKYSQNGFFILTLYLISMNVGDKAPEILGLNEKGEEIRLSNYKGKKEIQHLQLSLIHI